MSTPTLDVAELPPDTMDHRSPIWWGNLLMIVIESMMFALLIGAYFYLRGTNAQWPPPQSNRAIGIFDTNPSLFWPTINLAVILVSSIPMILADRAALRLACGSVMWGVGLTILIGLVAIGLRFAPFGEFAALNFRWDDNAYGSITWIIVGLHLLHLIVGTCENGIMFAWMARHGLDQKHARDIRVTAVYWYWIVGLWILLYAIVYLGPHYF
jgi:cytochrome c oxidase subunit 3